MKRLLLVVDSGEDHWCYYEGQGKHLLLPAPMVGLATNGDLQHAKTESVANDFDGSHVGSVAKGLGGRFKRRGKKPLESDTIFFQQKCQAKVSGTGSGGGFWWKISQ